MPKPITQQSNPRANALILGVLRDSGAGPECAPKSSGSASARSGEIAPIRHAGGDLEAALLEAATNLAAEWGLGGRGDEAEVIHGVVDELLELEANLDEDGWPLYYAARTATRALLSRDVDGEIEGHLETVG